MVKFPFATHKYLPQSKRKSPKSSPPSQPPPSSSQAPPERPAQPAFTLPPVPELQAIAGVARPVTAPATAPTWPRIPLPTPAYFSAPIPISDLDPTPAPAPGPAPVTELNESQVSVPAAAVSESALGHPQNSATQLSAPTPAFHFDHALRQSSPELPAQHPIRTQATAGSQDPGSSVMPSSSSFWPQYNYMPYPPPWAYYPQQTYAFEYQYPQQAVPAAGPARQTHASNHYIYAHPRAPATPVVHHVPRQPPRQPPRQVPAPQAPRPNIWYGRTRAQIAEDNALMAARRGTGANAPHDMSPQDPGDDRQFWVVELNGSHSLHNFATIEACKKPGKWMQNPVHGNLYFVRTRS